MPYFFSLSFGNFAHPDAAAANDWTIPQTVPDALPTLETTLHKPYGFLNAYTGYFRHVATTENEVNELGADAETLSPLDRRAHRLQHEDSKWDPEHYMYAAPLLLKRSFTLRLLNRADFADSEQIEELLAWTHPYLDPSSSVGDVVFTDAENATMLRLPRRECTYLSPPHRCSPGALTGFFFLINGRHRFPARDPCTSPCARHVHLLLRL